MFSQNLKTLRRAKGLSQEELAARLHVARQTVSKWENGLSVPDADLLIRLAEIFEVPVGKLLGDPVDIPEQTDRVAEKLEQLNLLLAERNRRSRRLLRTVGGILLGLLAAAVVCFAAAAAVFSIFPSSGFSENITQETAVVG